MKLRFKPTDFIVPQSTAPVILPSSAQPSFASGSTKFKRAAYDPTRRSLITERLDPIDAPYFYNYNEYLVALTSGGTHLSGPYPTPTTFIPHHQATPSTSFDGLPPAPHS